ncbi:unnamed protein product [Protopolystoma xenopodis]|uniref:Uncharacterized protein n=1 Tax=Protopolystoma xenopodis TaxID=117903 RepID=A0A3S5CSS4_9PLAT|nr:unnamed protein product [Protopolystoma xenopodis]
MEIECFEAFFCPARLKDISGDTSTWYKPTPSGSKPSSGPSSRSGMPGVRQRKVLPVASRRPVTPAAQKNPVWLFYSEDSPGIKVGPVPVLVIAEFKVVIPNLDIKGFKIAATCYISFFCVNKLIKLR